MVDQLSSGKTHRHVAAVFNTTPSTTHRIFKRWKEGQTLENKPRSGRPSKLTPAEKKYMLLLISRNRKITYAALVGAMGGRVSRKTIYRIVQSKWKRKWKAMRRIPISAECAKIRLTWAQGWRDDVHELMEVWPIEVRVLVEPFSRLT
jgi:transposase